MTYPLLDTQPPNSFEALQIWLGVLGEVGLERPAGGVLPYWMITSPSANDDEITEYRIFQIHSFDMKHDGMSAMYNAYQASVLAHRRLKKLAPRFGAQQPVQLSSGLVVYADGVSTKNGPVYNKYTDDGSIVSWVTDYEIPWRYIPAQS